MRMLLIRSELVGSIYRALPTEQLQRLTVEKRELLSLLDPSELRIEKGNLDWLHSEIAELVEIWECNPELQNQVCHNLRRALDGLSA